MDLKFDISWKIHHSSRNDLVTNKNSICWPSWSRLYLVYQPFSLVLSWLISVYYSFTIIVIYILNVWMCARPFLYVAVWARNSNLFSTFTLSITQWSLVICWTWRCSDGMRALDFKLEIARPGSLSLSLNLVSQCLLLHKFRTCSAWPSQ